MLGQLVKRYECEKGGGGGPGNNPSGSSGSGGGGGGGSSNDWYNTGRIPGGLDDDHKTAALPTYKKIRRVSPSVRHWMENYFAGPREGPVFDTVYTLGVTIDTDLEEAYEEGGLPAVELLETASRSRSA